MDYGVASGSTLEMTAGDIALDCTVELMCWVYWRDILRVLDIVCCCCVLLPIVWSIKQLRLTALGVRNDIRAVAGDIYGIAYLG